MNQVESVHQTIEVIKELVENKPIAFTSIYTEYGISQPQILHTVIIKKIEYIIYIYIIHLTEIFYLYLITLLPIEQE